MAGDEHNAADEAKFKGIKKYFNNETVKGRANVALATYIFLALVGVYKYLKPKKTKN